MAVTYGFFDSVNGDRKYNANTMSEFYTGICTPGVFQHVNNGLAVSAGTGLTVNVATGRALIQNHWVKNDSVKTLTVSAASATYARIDAVVIRFSKSNRSISILMKDGTAAASPSAPSMTRNSDVYEFALAYVNVAANASSVTVTDKRSDSSVCGWAAVAQATSGEVDQMLNDMKTGFDGVTYPSPVEMVQGCDTKLSNNMIGFDNGIMEKVDRIAEIKNLMPVEKQEVTNNNVKSVYEDGVLTLSGTGSANGGKTVTRISLAYLEPGQYTISSAVISGIPALLTLFDGDTLVQNDLRNASCTFTVTAFSNIRLTITTALNWTENAVYNIQLNKGSTAGTYVKPSDSSAIDSVARDNVENIEENIVQRSNNLLPIEEQIYNFNGLIITYEDGVLTLSGTSSATGVSADVEFKLPAGTYTIKAIITSGTGEALRLWNIDSSSYISYDLREDTTFTLNAETNLRITSTVTSTTYTYNYTANLMLNTGESIKSFENPSFVSAIDKVARAYIDNTYLYSRLNGKKYTAAGDSITYGDAASSASKTYGALAASYLGMNFLNIAMSGRTMADIHVDGVSRNGFAVERYLLVPDDTDYLTILFGFNDGAYGKVSMEDDYCMDTYGKYYSQCTAEEKAEADAHADWFEVFIGTTASTDKKTWCGAWKFVLDYFVNTKSIPHIGVILPYGVDTRMTDPLKTLCGMYAVPYIDMASAQNVPTIGYTRGANQDVNAHNRNLYTADGLHPNDEGYRRIANAIIQWLQRI